MLLLEGVQSELIKSLFTKQRNDSKSMNNIIPIQLSHFSEWASRHLGQKKILLFQNPHVELLWTLAFRHGIAAHLGDSKKSSKTQLTMALQNWYLSI